MTTGQSGQGFALRLQRAWLGRGPLAVALLPLACVFGFVSAIRRRLYRIHLLKSEQLPVPVIVVGNLIAGGAGKTPTVMAVVELLRRRGFTPGIISRGYGRSGDTVVDVHPDMPVATAGDEPLLMRLRTGAPVCVGRDRVAAGRELLRLHAQVDVVVSDDGLQHLRLARTAQVLVFDERGAGNGWLLPAGPLREPLPSALPQRTVLLYNAPRHTTPLPGSAVQRSLTGVASLADWRAGRGSSQAELASLRDRSNIHAVTAAAGLAHPERFFGMLRDLGISIAPLPLPDHFDYAVLPWPAETRDVVVTEKDAVKLDPARLGASRVWVAALDFVPAAEFEAALMALLPRPASPT